MSEPRWKHQERRVARLTGTKRNPRNGSQSPDAESNWLVVENKDRGQPPLWIYQALSLARQKAGRDRLGIVTITSRSDSRVLVVMDLQDFVDWHGPVKQKKDSKP